MKVSAALKSHFSLCSNGSFSAAVRPLYRRVYLRWEYLAAMLAVFALFQAPLAEAQATTTTTLALSSSSVALGTAVTFTATVANGSPVTLGTVNFCNSAFPSCFSTPGLVETEQLTSAGTAVIHLTPGIGSHTYYAVFRATTSNATSTSPTETLTVTGTYTTVTTTVVLTVGDFFNLDITSAPTQTVKPGGDAAYNLTVSPVLIPTLPGIVTFTVTGLPPGATATLTPSTILAGSGTTAVVMTVDTSSTQAGNRVPSQQSQPPAALGMLLPLLGMVSLRKRLAKIPRLYTAVLLGVLTLGSIVGLTGCGAICTIGPQPTAYTLVVTAHCGGLQHSVDITLDIQQ
jgi:hypothetical protein